MKRFEHDDENEWQDVAPDRKILRVPLTMMDSLSRAVATSSPLVNDTVMHRPGYAATTDEDRVRRQQLYADAEQKLCDRWKNPAPLAPDVGMPAPQPVDPALGAQDAAYARYDQDISERWRTPAGAARV